MVNAAAEIIKGPGCRLDRNLLAGRRCRHSALDRMVSRAGVDGNHQNEDENGDGRREYPDDASRGPSTRRSRKFQICSM